MRRPLVAGNWKMNLNRAQAVELAKAVVEQAGQYPKVDIALCPPSVYLDAVGHVLAGSPVALAAQNVYYAANGAFTGEVSAAMLADLGCRYVIVGHSERRHILGETDKHVKQKVHAALPAGLLPIVCVGELLDDRQAGRTTEVIARQFNEGLSGLSADQMRQIVIAYEPVWAIGTGQVATPEQAGEVHTDLRKMLEQRYNSSVAQSVRILYGGSVKASNAARLLAQPDIDGALVGGASLTAEEFMGIVAAASSE